MPAPQFHPPRRPDPGRDGWADFLRVFVTVLAIVAFVLPAGEVAVVVVSDAEDAPRVTVLRGRPLSPGFVFDPGKARAAGDDGFADGADDDDFRPSPDRCRGASARHAACPSPLAVLSVGPPPSDNCLKRPPPHDRGRFTPLPSPCPALDTSVQFLC